MADSYDHKAIESKWQKKWTEQKLYETPDNAPGKENFYTLVEFPYPSGDLHVGHWYAFSVPDAFARMKRMQGYNVLYPIGFDAFGLPAENAAIKNKADPAKWTFANIERMHGQLKSMGASFDWNREVAACDPAYYRWTQWLFLKLFEKGLAYKGKAFVNWDPVDMTVLANEQVLPDGTAERSGAKVEKKELEQWFLKITDYADRLLADLDALEWPEPIKESQRNWIGRSEGAEIDFELVFDDPTLNEHRGPDGEKAHIPVFTTRPDTLFGATFLVLAPEHLWVTLATDAEHEVLANKQEVIDYVKAAKRKPELERMAGEKEKTGVELKGVKAINPATCEKIPLWTADYVLAGYGTGAIMAVPAHDERDRAFAEKFNLEVRTVIAGGVLVHSGNFDGLQEAEGKRAITEAFGRPKKTYKLRDWLISRQRYWGAPIPIVYDPEGKAHAIPDEHLPWLLPTDVDFTPTGIAPLGRSQELKERTEKIFGKGWTPEIDTMDTFVDSSWYFLRYLDAKNAVEFSSLEKQKAWMPVARYSGGAEHTTMHLLYSRFFYKALFDLGLVTESEPYAVRMNRGIILAEDGRKMSKRWGNVVNPDEEVARVGADAVRTYLAFIGPYNEVGSYPWSTNGLIGVRRFLERAAGFIGKIADTPVPGALEGVLHRTVKKVGEDIESMKFNTSVSALMILANEFQKLGAIPKSAYETFLLLLAPFAPHLTDELWERLGHKNSIHLETWPSFDVSKLEAATAVIAVQIAGKTRGTVVVPRGADRETVLAALKGDPKLAKAAPEREERVIFVPDKVINIIPGA
jgi:leucyl-tRNA synthetase